MEIHKNTRLTPYQRKDIYKKHFEEKSRVSDLARQYNVTRPTIYKILARGRVKE
jgi:transposase-like protein